MTEIDVWLEDQARTFSDKIGDLVARCLPGAPGMRVSVVGGKVRIRPDGQTSQQGGVPLHVDGAQLAWLRINYSCRPDSTRKYLAVDTSKLWIVSTRDRSPLFRCEYNYDSRAAPHSHIQVHADRGTLSHLLTRTRHGRPHDMSALHLPTGGSRFRPDLEDVSSSSSPNAGSTTLTAGRTRSTSDGRSGGRSRPAPRSERWRQRPLPNFATRATR